MVSTTHDVQWIGILRAAFPWVYFYLLTSRKVSYARLCKGNRSFLPFPLYHNITLFCAISWFWDVLQVAGYYYIAILALLMRSHAPRRVQVMRPTLRLRLSLAQDHRVIRSAVSPIFGRWTWAFVERTSINQLQEAPQIGKYDLLNAIQNSIHMGSVAPKSNTVAHSKV